MNLMQILAIVFIVTLIFQLGACAPPPASINPQARYLTSSTSPICLFLCTTVVTSNEAAQFPELRRAGEVTGNSKTTSNSSTVTTP